MSKLQQRKFFKRLYATGAVCVFVNMTACGQKTTEEPVVVTQIDELLADTSHLCKEALLSVGADLITDKDHFLTLTAIPTVAENKPDSESNENASNYNISADEVNVGSNSLNADSINAPLLVNGLLEYKDRPAHIRFTATDITNNRRINELNNKESKQSSICLVSYQLDYHFDEPCMSIREDAFKKWNQLKILTNKNGQTRYFQHKRKPNKKSFLTDLERNTQCLVSVQELQTIKSN